MSRLAGGVSVRPEPSHTLALLPSPLSPMGPQTPESDSRPESDAYTASAESRPSAPSRPPRVECRAWTPIGPLSGKRDQRAFLPIPIAEDALRRILQAGRMTGSSKNREPNRFVVVRDRERLSALGALSPLGRWIARAAAAIAIVQTEVTSSTPAVAPEHDAGGLG